MRSGRLPALYVAHRSPTYNRRPIEPVRLPLEGQTAYAELLTELLRGAHGARPGSIVRKTIGGRDYLYVQERALGRMRQSYLGPDSAEVRARARELEAAWEARRERDDRRASLVRVARAGGLAAPTAAEAKVLEALAGVGLFEVGGVLVGTHAFAVIGNALGVSLEATAIRTGDIDLDHDPRILVAAPHHEAADLKRLEKRGGPIELWPIPGFDPREPSTSFRVHKTELHVDLLTPLRGRPRGAVHIPILNAAAMPLRFLDYLVEETMPAAIVAGSGVLVHVPTPARFALHKLIVAADRPAAFATKARKDLLQAEALLTTLLVDRPDDVATAWKALVAKGKGWRGRAEKSLRRIDADVARAVAK